MRVDTGIGNSQVTGAASQWRMFWPRGIQDGGDPTGVAHGSAQADSGFVVTAYAAGTQQTLIFAGTGAAAVDFKSTVAAGNGFGLGVSRAFSVFNERSGGRIVSETACMEWRATIAFTNPAGATALDHGIFVLPGNQNTMQAAANAGIQFGVSGPQQISLIARAVNGGALTVNQVVAAALTPNVTKFNTYALRMISGSASSDPVVFGLINNVVVTNRVALTAAAALLPQQNVVVGNLGYRFHVINISAANVPDMFVHDVVLTCAQNEADLT